MQSKARGHVELLYLVVLATIAAVAPRVILPITLKTDVPLAVIESGSMEPTLHVGDLVIIRGVSPGEVKQGDIIVFRARFLGGSLTVHRVIRIIHLDNVTLYRTKGDANFLPDPAVYSGLGSVSEDDVVGKVIVRIPLIGYITLGFTKLLIRNP